MGNSRTTRKKTPKFIKESSMNIFIGNIPVEMTEDELLKEFSAFGTVKAIAMMDDKDIGSGQPTGYAFVEMAAESEGDAAIAGLKGKVIKGISIELIKSLPFTDNKDRHATDSRRGSRYNRVKQRDSRNRLHHMQENTQ